MSTLKVNKIENTATTDGGIEIDSDGHVQFDGIQLPTAGPLSNRNLIINGAMQVAQRGTSFTASGYGVDRWQMQFPAAVGITHTQETLSSGDPYNEGFRYFMRADVTTADTTSARWAQFTTRIEAQNLAQSGWKYTDTNSYITISFWARSSLSGTYYVVLRAADAPNYTFPKSFTLVGGTWKKITCSIPGNSNLVFNNDAGEGLEILVKPDYGSDFTGSEATDNAWYNRTVNDWVPDYSQNWLGTVGNTFDLTGVQLEVGDKATPFEHRSFGDELQACQRYFQKSYPYSESIGSTQYAGGYIWRSNTATTVSAYLPVQFRHELRATPDIDVYSVDGTIDRVAAGTGSGGTLQNWVAGASSFGATAMMVYLNASPSTAYYNVFFHYTVDAEL